jgi:hypothetical protein
VQGALIKVGHLWENKSIQKQRPTLQRNENPLPHPQLFIHLP